MRNLKIGQEMSFCKLTDILDADGYSISYYIHQNVINLKIGEHSEKLTGSINDRNGTYNVEFESVGTWEVKNNTEYSNIYTTLIDKESLNIKITDIYSI